MIERRAGSFQQSLHLLEGVSGLRLDVVALAPHGREKQPAVGGDAVADARRPLAATDTFTKAV